MRKARAIAVGALALGATLALGVGDASARMFARSFHGFYGVHSYSFSRVPGHTSGTRSFQAYNGRGYTHTFSRGCSGGTCSGSASTVANSGKTWSHSGSVAGTGNNSANYSRNAAGANGGSGSLSGSCVSGSCAGTGSITTASGNTYSSQRSATWNGNGVVNHTNTVTGPQGNTATRSYNTLGLFW